MPTIEKRKITHFGRIIRRNNIHRLILEGPLERTITRERPTTECMTNIKELTGMRLAQDREQWSHYSPLRRRHLMMMVLEAISLKICHGSMFGLPCGGIEVQYDVHQNSSASTRGHGITTLGRFYHVLLNRPIKVVLSANTCMIHCITLEKVLLDPIFLLNLLN